MLLKIKVTMMMMMMMMMIWQPPNIPADNRDIGGHDGEEIDGELNDDHNDNDDNAPTQSPS